MYLPALSLADRKLTQQRYRVCTRCPHAQGAPRLKCQVGQWRDCGDLARENVCPEGRFPGQTRKTGVVTIEAAPQASGPWGGGRGAAAWAHLHLFALSSPTREKGESWFQNFLHSLPCGDCRRHAHAYVESHPVTWESFFDWTVEFHNAVNERLRKPTVTLEVARSRWMSIPRTFDAVYVLSLPQDAERRERLAKELQERGWPFPPPEIVEGVDGRQVRGGSTAGCMAGHRKILQLALERNQSSVLILEDDATLAPDFATRVLAFFTRLPANWDALFLGHQNAWWREGSSGLPRFVEEGVVRSTHPHRLHAYALRGEAIRACLDKLRSVPDWDHADHALGELLGVQFHTYAPHPPLIGQAAGYSHLMGKNDVTRFWESTPRAVRRVVITLNLGEDRMRPAARESQQDAARRWKADWIELREGGANALEEKLRLDKFVAGYDRVVYFDRDIIIRSTCPDLFDLVPAGSFAAAYDDDVVSGKNQRGREQMESACRSLGLEWGGAYFNSGVLVFQPPIHDSVFALARELAKTLPHDWPFLDQGILSAALLKSGMRIFPLDFAFNPCGQVFWEKVRRGHVLPYPVLHFCGHSGRDSFIDAVDWKKEIQWPTVGDRMILLQAPRSVREALRSQGWHGGFEVNGEGEDPALRSILSSDSSVLSKLEAIQRWVPVIQNEASRHRLLPVVWSVGGEYDLLREALGSSAVSISADSVDAAHCQLPDEWKRPWTPPSRPVVRLVTTLRNGDVSLLPHFLAHYRELGVERFCLCVNVVGPGFTLDEIRGWARPYEVDWHVYADSACTDSRQEEEQRSGLRLAGADRDDWILYTDLDEFQTYPAPLPTVLKAMEQKSIVSVKGHFVDRLSADGSLTAVEPGRPIFDQYPVCSNLTGRLLAGWTQKVMVARYSVWTWIGHHAAEDRSTPHVLNRWPTGSPNDYQVHHFKWRAGLVERLRFRIPQMESTGECWKWVQEAKTILAYLESHGGKFNVNDPVLECSKI